MTQPAKHTPGPWFANQSEMEAHSCKVEIRTTNGAYLICSDAGYQNAPLIAAAPAMYEALKTAMAYFMRSNQSHAPEVRVIRAALAQAEGLQ